MVCTNRKGSSEKQVLVHDGRRSSAYGGRDVGCFNLSSCMLRPPSHWHLRPFQAKLPEQIYQWRNCFSLSLIANENNVVVSYRKSLEGKRLTIVICKICQY